MQTLDSDIDFQTAPADLSKTRLIAPLPVFYHRVIELFDQLSSRILSSEHARAYPDLAAFGFFCRRRNLDKAARRYTGDDNHRVGRGVTLHFASSNVPLIHAYSLLAGLLSGNVCCVRMSSRVHEQAVILNSMICDLLKSEDFSELLERVHIFQYPHDDATTEFLTSLCDVRVIWGSDETIDALRRFKIPARSYDLTFADRYSGCIVDALGYLEGCDADVEAQRFYNDTLYFDQNACTSPRFVYWMGDSEIIEQAQLRFWKAFHKAVTNHHYENRGNMVVEKLLQKYRCAIDLGASDLGEWPEFERICIQKIPDQFEEYCAPGGYFVELCSTDFSRIRELTGRKLQTLTYMGTQVDNLWQQLDHAALFGVDRIVPNGQASDFELLWDGYDLISHLSRRIVMR